MTATAQVNDDYIDIRIPRQMFGKKPFSRSYFTLVCDKDAILVELNKSRDEFETRYTKRSQVAFKEAERINEEMKAGIRQGFTGTTAELFASILEDK